MVGVIDAYIGHLDRALHGPKHAKSDLLAEARDGLVDAAAAYENAGLGRLDAERRAVADFGDVSEVAPDYQIELGLTQSRRTAWLMLLTLGIQPFLWQGWWPWFADVPAHDAGPAYVVVNAVVEWLGLAAIVTSLFAVLIHGVGSRYIAVRQSLIRVVGIGTLLTCGTFATLGVALSTLGPDQSFVTGLLWITPFLFLPLTAAASAARKCLILAQVP